jgi:hypothetical protein
MLVALILGRFPNTPPTAYELLELTKRRQYRLGQRGAADAVSVASLLALAAFRGRNAA